LSASGDHIFASIDTVFVPDNVFRWGLISYGGLVVRVKIFPLLNPQTPIFRPVFGCRKTLYNGDAKQ